MVGAEYFRCAGHARPGPVGANCEPAIKDIISSSSISQPSMGVQPMKESHIIATH
jgi:hypothetical protein